MKIENKQIFKIKKLLKDSIEKYKFIYFSLDKYF